jgi:hypothetical protein|tara:strand:- start:38 stop:265 length:228 start_codon:yes stop_codon:yes gene_type:complete
MPNNKKVEATSVASPRSRKGNEKTVFKSKTGRQAQTEFVEMINKMFNTINAQIEVEPNANTIDNIINKKDKKKLN